MVLKDLLKVLDPNDKISITMDGTYADDSDPCYVGYVVSLMVRWHDLTWDTNRRVISLSYDTSSDTYQVMLAS